LLLDAAFGARNFRNEIIWKRKTGRGETSHKSNKFGTCTDSIFCYGKSERAMLNAQFNPDAPGYQDYVGKFFRHVDERGRRFALDNLASPSKRPNLMYEYKGYKPPEKGWAISREKMEQWDKEGRLFFPSDKGARIRRKRFLDELAGKPVQNLWDDIEMIGAQAAERLGYPTQKPVALLDRIIQASSLEGDVVLDPFCGCGTTIIAAQQTKRQWIGIDVTCLAVTLMKHRIKETFGGSAQYVVVGEPVSLPDAAALALQDRMQFQWWALGLVGARPVEQKKGADQGIDGKLFFHDTHALQKGDTNHIVISVKSGHVSVKDVRDLRGVIEREHAAIGVLICLEEVTKPMRQEAASAGCYHSDGWHQDFPRVQILTIQELLDGRGIEYPYQQYSNVSFRKAKQAKDVEATYDELPLETAGVKV
jgi:site-specific DNA-methyltransferase (adenine-specific)